MKTKKSKTFDGVQMKWDIQQQIRQEFAAVSEAEAREKQMRQVARDPILGPVYKRLAAKRESAHRR